MASKNLPKKQSEMTTQELFVHFKEGTIEMIKEHFNEHGNQIIEPAVFIGVKQNALANHADFLNSLPPVVKQQIMENIHDEHKIHTLCLPLGKLFQDHGNEIMNKASKNIARRMVDEAVNDFRKIDVNSVMFVLFVTEAYMAEHIVDDKTAQDIALGRKSIDSLIPDGGVRSMPGTKEVITLMYETLTSSQLITFDILRSDEYQEAINMREFPEMNQPSEGLFSGILHSGNHTNFN
jgi:hypothetical protein